MSTFAPRRLGRVAVALFIATVSGCTGDEAATAPPIVSKPHAILGPTVLVTNTYDAGPGSLRQTLSAAVTGSTIQLDRSGDIGRALVLLARARLARADTAGARDPLRRAIPALEYGLGPNTPSTRDARRLAERIGAR